MGTQEHGLTVTEVPRPAARAAPVVEPCFAADPPVRPGAGRPRTGAPRNPDGAPISAVADVRRVPLSRIATDDDSLRRVIPDAGTARVPVAAFNASL
jgi:hypothetical protein